MKSATILSAFVFAWNVAAIQNSLKGFRRLSRTRVSVDDPPIPSVPTYNISIPRDHFSDDPQTYQNRYAVNDTYYKPGGPVIFYDLGESAMDPSYVGELLAEYNGTVSAPLRLAEQLNGLVIAWEHRYYGYSQPVENDETSGVPPGGAADYQYLTVEQALEDVIYFANRFNTTALPQNDNVQSTDNLDPYHTPWLALGASYPGIRAAWLRQRNPEVFYASWASSAPLETRTDGSIYWNPIYRALPGNCTKDIKAVFAYVDETLTSGSQDEIDFIRAGAYLVAPQSYSTGSPDLVVALAYTDTETVNALTSNLLGSTYQSYGAGQTLQVLCDWMESFGVESYLSSFSSPSDLRSQMSAVFSNTGGSTPSDDGIVASQSSNGSAIGLAAFLFANSAYLQYQNSFFSNFPRFDYLTPNIDAASWTWQTLSQMGYFIYNNDSNPDAIFSNFLTLDDTLNQTKGYYLSSFLPSDIPARPNFTEPLSFGGWSAHPTNVMFTNGEFDPWRAFGVASQEQFAGAPARALTQTIPTCNRGPDGSDVFGLLYPGAVHAEDMSIVPYSHRASPEGAQPPLYQGLDLFARAYAQWLPCFNQSRDDVRNGRGVDGQGTGSGSGSGSGSSSASNAAASLYRVGSSTVTAVLSAAAVVVLTTPWVSWLPL